jgi:transposase InsO family protein
MTWRRPRQHSIVKRTWESYDPFYSIVIDYLGPFAEDNLGYKYLFVVIDNFSRYVRIFPTKDATAYSAAIALLDICMMFSTVRMIASDQPKTFTSSTYRQILLFLSADPHTLYLMLIKPLSNGAVKKYCAIYEPSLCPG